MATRSEVERITSALLKIHRANTLERRAYLVMSTASFVVLMGVSIHAYLNRELESTTIISMFGATGVIGLCITRILAIWRDCLNIIRAVVERGERP